MKDPLAAFLRHLAVERNASAHTLRSYRTDLDDFQRFLASQHAEGLSATDARAVRAWLAALHARGLAPASVGRKLAALRSCFRFLVRRGVMAGRYHVARAGHDIAVGGQPFEADHLTSRLCVTCHAAASCWRDQRPPMTTPAAPPSRPAAIGS